MTVSSLSASTQNYVKIIWGLSEWSTEPVTTGMIADKAGVKKSTVSDALRKLSDAGLVEHSRYSAVTLTDQGREYALAMVRRHRLIETFLVDTLGYRWEQVDLEADALEHVVSDLMIERLDEHLGHPQRDPHGDPIPTAQGAIHRPPAVSLARCEPESVVSIARIADDDPELLQYLANHNIGLDTRVRVSEGPPFSESITITPDNGHVELTISTTIAESIFAIPSQPGQ
ncbi:Iron-dependent repressor IdeR [Corynebacterium ciconiae DSM 44920]|uniref:metal-dependent transcriptional regulator n=1 Tax=Corynebacterium ciconiae TaxID=227319 RepID=UPI000360FE0F|nr:metal-dependent transcriptional regulator [Corynebacterium ciconiae]WKD60409.1 Iron-dependent repressor IdeR [Corynebacterium ciconiae DSM 44920]